MAAQNDNPLNLKFPVFLKAYLGNIFKAIEDKGNGESFESKVAFNILAGMTTLCGIIFSAELLPLHECVRRGFDVLESYIDAPLLSDWRALRDACYQEAKEQSSV